MPCSASFPVIGSRQYQEVYSQFVGTFIVHFGSVCEYLREVRKFFTDTFSGGFPAGMMQTRNADTMTGRIFVLVASLIVGAGRSYLKRCGKEATFRDMVENSPHYNP